MRRTPRMLARAHLLIAVAQPAVGGMWFFWEGADVLMKESSPGTCSMRKMYPGICVHCTNPRCTIVRSN